MKAITKKLIELGAKSTNVKTTLRKLPAQDRKKWTDKIGLITKDLEDWEEVQRKKAQKKYISVQAKKHNLSVSEYLRLKRKAEKILDDFHTGHRMGCYRYLGLNGKPFVANHDLKDYARSCKYSPTYGSLTINLNKKELREIQLIGHLWTIKGKEVSPKVFECKILNDTGVKQNYAIGWESWFITSDFHSATIENAKVWRRIRAEQLWKNRKRVADNEKLKNRFVGFRHSIQAGNCQSGTASFCKKHGLNPDFGYRLDFILSLENSEFTNRLFSAL